MESVMTMILKMLFLAEAWLMPYLIANNSASVLVTKATCVMGRFGHEQFLFSFSFIF